MKKLNGIVTAMITPLTNNDELDIPALRALCDYLIDRGVDCLYPTGSMGEMLRLSESERKCVVETVVKQAAGRVPVYAHVGAVTTKETVALAEHAQAVGADGIGVVTPAYFPLTEREMEQYFRDVASSVDIPMYLYGIPQYAANDISPMLAARLHAACRNIIGIKFSVADFIKTREYLSIGGFDVLQGSDRHTLPFLSMEGIRGIVSGNSSACPEPYVAVKRALDKGDLQAAREADRALQAYTAAMGFGSIAMEKAFLALRGVNVGGPRRPALPPTDEQIAAMRETVAALDAKYASLFSK